MKKISPLPVIINIARDRLFLCTHTLTDPVVFPFTPTMISDLEIKDKNELDAKLGEFMQKTQIKPSPLVIILAEHIYFHKDFPKVAPPAEEETQKFIDSVPFSNVSSKLFHTPDGYRLVVINRDIYEIFEQVFDRLGFQLHSVVPGFVLGAINAPAEFSAQTCRIIYKKLDFLSDNSFTTPFTNAGDLHRKEQVFIQKYKISLAIISSAFIIFSAVMAYITLFRPQAIPRKKALPAASVLSVPSPVPATPTPTASPSAQALGQITVQVLNGSGVAGLAASVEAQLKLAGFTTVRTGNAPLINSGPSYMVLRPDLPPAVKALLTSVVQKVFPSLSVRENVDTLYDVILTTGKVNP
ncbi:MAG: hypothetical protein UY33_C0006G0007 [Candidatus Amesbacteria bacterium GW2011_GWA1_48_9]|uniref:LytR/CpsA/Psr regulator C-terminal domain-containing protein n=1 Tax=Candidatus Amesbacteria bacterium GW2011_GWA1_48_9 TaxID=1618355 RepID=A0A0G1V2J4_9BACT|nr:MAG: hypothetical protein UY33_C0006G0007 [Candidatus Amesbacteria bacterium GW2011_GWA1_48_9]OGC89845.1 MAG: hypothetical protein A2V48_04470 [Candidatus Amesbacteria bacterium RBG_19FT_COMBO_48_16]OGC98630.1 MAG: hypothetical protein A2W16_02370 [Candidatus Amesbacteria bacterium RBG_16_48_31]OGC99896.1 MAG: hypothetical protein A2702_02690 [Candidatus Amesbacteria bacterium RIFCSPHIGHO2_01_FULL_48_75]OGD01421.1 MAG: hypothetical protein A2354_00280 [Candidatus Amesbacteria bacterium RIFOX